MESTVISSTAFLTFLMAIGLFFFIRASTKDRTEVSEWVFDQSQESLLERFQAYFSQRAYRVAGIDADKNQVTYEGFVRPSIFLAIFLSLLAAVGLLCLSLVLALLYPQLGLGCLVFVAIAPGAGLFYWKKAGRAERVLLNVNAVEGGDTSRNRITITAHRDELIELRRVLNLD